MENQTKQVDSRHDTVIRWEAPEYVQHDKGWKWFLGAGIVDFLLCVYAVATNNWTLLIALVLLSSVYIWQHGSVPKNIEINVSRTGIKVGEKEYPYQQIKSFWIIYKPPMVKTLNLRSNSRILPDIAIQLGDQDPAQLRTYLCSQIREEEGKEESTVEALIRIFKL
ncbi:hypothetical protein GF369_00545 [Candidatus Peregrinibacteria bacterium]|nr:hypothetical protein [Candidatus Peregrinibacteria bacterium]